MATRAFPSQQEIVQFSSFSGADIVCTIGSQVFGELQAIAFSVEREIAPIYTMGSPTLRAYSRGKRGITGTLIFQVFDRDSLLEALLHQMHLDNIDIHTAAANLITENEQYRIYETPGIGAWNQAMEDEIAKGDVTPDTLFKRLLREKIRYADQVPPFDITITGSNELGLTTSLRILKVQLMTEASGVSVDDLTMEKACSFIAREVIPWGYEKINPAVAQEISRPAISPDLSGGIYSS